MLETNIYVRRESCDENHGLELDIFGYTLWFLTRPKFTSFIIIGRLAGFTLLGVLVQQRRRFRESVTFLWR
jgi:hypothetical protein